MMDFIAPAIEGVLVVLLIAALLYGMRLEKKLKALRDTQAGFAEAVRMLDQAAARAENGLDTLRRTAEDTHDGLHSRITKARELKTELEGLVARAERAAVNLDRPLPRANATSHTARTRCAVAQARTRARIGQEPRRLHCARGRRNAAGADRTGRQDAASAHSAAHVPVHVDVHVGVHVDVALAPLRRAQR